MNPHLFGRKWGRFTCLECGFGSIMRLVTNSRVRDDGHNAPCGPCGRPATLTLLIPGPNRVTVKLVLCFRKACRANPVARFCRKRGFSVPSRAAS